MKGRRTQFALALQPTHQWNRSISYAEAPGLRADDAVRGRRENGLERLHAASVLGPKDPASVAS